MFGKAAGLLGLLLGCCAEDPVKVAPISLVVPAYVEDIPRLPIFAGSVGTQTVQPAEVILVINIPLSSNYQGPLFFPGEEEFDFSNFTGVAWAPRADEEKKALNTLYKEIGYIMNDVFVKTPAVRVWTRTDEHSDEENRLFGASKTLVSSQLISFFTPSDLMHPKRIETLWHQFEASESDVILHGAMTLICNKSILENYNQYLVKVENDQLSSLSSSRIRPEAFPASESQDGDLAADMQLPLHTSWFTVRPWVLGKFPMEEHIGTQTWMRGLDDSVTVTYLNAALGAMLDFSQHDWSGEKRQHLHSSQCDFSTFTCSH
ncbi:hypothetical protein GNI_066340 [Gregarina niphandrodes]|uniref:Transmembrane protein n=1 Tax=Gregarina niphandrodes TaxID=110365 RepID=A0A023B7T9_GRENI|nr:hypothetical protein GNI_066340 [Gregarina niphandrodes]EZG67805.1 hypothetical protein GNI_066340 [Gregarina niphandrodes]|eukprot:XP_011130154.1 hypothetical protein GNI_066340 [Gregarina niphandrodes]